MNTLLGFVFMFLVSWLLINPIAKKNNTETKAEFLITVSWADKSALDVDTYVEDPQGNIVWYHSKQAGIMHLDRDDVGMSTDTVTNDDGSITQVYINREVVTLRGYLPGEYTVNVHMFTPNEPIERTEVTVDVVKLNPYAIVGNKKVILEAPKQEETALRFTVAIDGTVSNVHQLRKEIKTQQTSGGSIQ